MADFSRAGSPMVDDDGAVVGQVWGLSVVSDERGFHVEVNGFVRGVALFGCPDARFTAEVPIGEGWALVKLSEWQKRGAEAVPSPHDDGAATIGADGNSPGDQRGPGRRPAEA